VIVIDEPVSGAFEKASVLTDPLLVRRAPRHAGEFCEIECLAI